MSKFGLFSPAMLEKRVVRVSHLVYGFSVNGMVQGGTDLQGRKRLRGLRLYFKTFKEPRNRFQGLDPASLCSLAGRQDKPIPTRFLAPIDCYKIPALIFATLGGGWLMGGAQCPALPMPL
jgi:hypothetical protein